MYPNTFGTGKLRNIIIFNILVLLISSCNSPSENEENDGGYNIDLPIFPNSYSDPSVSPDGEQILFRRVKITNFNSGGGYNVDYDSTGIWIAQSDGSAMRLLLNYGGSPSLSPDGQWMVFESGAQIYKVPFDSGEVDMSGMVQLTDRGRNFGPTWSPDGKWIAYDNTDCGSAPLNSCGVLMIENSGSEKQFVVKGRMPDWSPDGEYLIYIGFHREIYRVDVNNTTKVVQLTSLNQNDIYATNNQYPKYSPGGTQIVFMSQAENKVPQIWVMHSDGSDPQKLTSYGGQDPTWTPDGKINPLCKLVWLKKRDHALVPYC